MRTSVFILLIGIVISFGCKKEIIHPVTPTPSNIWGGKVTTAAPVARVVNFTSRTPDAVLVTCAGEPRIITVVEATPGVITFSVRDLDGAPVWNSEFYYMILVND